MFERYTETARRAIFYARYYAGQYGSEYIESEHILLGLLRADAGWLKDQAFLGADALESLQQEVEKQHPPRKHVNTSVDMPVSRECKQIFDYANEEADRMQHRTIETGHLLAAILRKEGCLAERMLSERGVRLSTVREQLAKGALLEHLKKAPQFEARPHTELRVIDATTGEVLFDISPLSSLEFVFHQTEEVVFRGNTYRVESVRHIFEGDHPSKGHLIEVRVTHVSSS